MARSAGESEHPEAPGWLLGQPLRLEGVSVERGGRPILAGIDLTLEPGRRYVVVGPSGSGKSTLLRLLNRLEDPATGRIWVGTIPLERLPIRSVRTAVGLVFQTPRPLPGTLAENLHYPALVRGRSLPDRPRLAGALAEVGLDPGWLDRDASGLSGGERQRLAIATALLVEPELLLLDEPTAALDPASARQLADRLAERSRRDGLRTVIVSHQRDLAPRLGETVVVLQAGRVTEVGPTAAVLGRLDATVWGPSPPRPADPA